ncbi:MAG: hypothetical protein R3B99_08565 [Polyangiales bacterium]
MKQMALAGFAFDREHVLAMWRMQGWFVARLFHRDGGLEAERSSFRLRAGPQVVALAEGLGVQLGRFVSRSAERPTRPCWNPRTRKGFLCADFDPGTALLGLPFTSRVEVEGATPMSFHADVEIDVTRQCVARLTPSRFAWSPLSATPPPSYEASEGRLRNGDLACTIRW